MTQQEAAMQPQKTNTLFAETLSFRSARIMQDVAKEFEGVEVRLLDERVPEHAEIIASVLNARYAGFIEGGERPYSAPEIYHEAMQRPESSTWFPFVIVEAETDQGDGSPQFDTFISRVSEEWREHQAALEASRVQHPQPGLLKRALGRIGLS